MTTEAERDAALQEDAMAPKEATADGVTVDTHPLQDRIAVDRYARSKEASRQTGIGVKRTQIVPPGAI
jgi:hypothetical protein